MTLQVVCECFGSNFRGLGEGGGWKGLKFGWLEWIREW